MNNINRFYYDDQFLDDPDIDDLDDFHVCPRCNTEFETMEELEYIEEHHVCPSCLSDLTLQAAEDSMDI
jgi:hydrogenase maturation factor HypF (carbamoyltransferase family)